MKKITPHGTLLFLIIALFANTAMAQYTFTWKTAPVDNNWANTANWTRTGTSSGGSTSVFPGQTASTDLVVISNGGTPILASATLTVARMTISNTTGPVTGSVLTINSGATLNVTSGSITNVVLNGGNIVNNGALNIATTATDGGGSSVYGFICGLPAVLPTVPTEYGYSGSGTLSINLSTTNSSNSSLIVSNGTSTSANAGNATYKLVLNNPTLNYNQGTTLAIGAIRTIGVVAANFAPKLLISGSGFTVGTEVLPYIGSLFSLGSGTSLTIDTGTNITFYSKDTNTFSGITSFHAAASTISLTIKGTINYLGASKRSGIGLSTGSPSAASVFDIVNEGTLNITLNCSSVGQSAYNIGNGGGGTANAGSVVNLTNASTGVLTFKNTSTIVGTGNSVFCTTAGEAPRTIFNNNGTATFDGTVYNFGSKFTINNSGILNSNNELRSFTAINNAALATINFVKNSSTAVTRQVVFNGLTTASASASGTVYSDGTNNYTVVNQKSTGSGTQLTANVISTANVGIGAGTLTLISGTGDATINFSSVSLVNTNNALAGTASNSGIINTGEGLNLGIISGVVTTSTSEISPGGSTGKGIASFTGTPKAITGKLLIQASGNSASGVDYDQIINTSLEGGFDISATTLEITSLYTPTPSVSIAIVTTSGLGTISGTFTSVTGLTTGWTISYASPTSVNLEYTVITIPTIWTGVANNDFFNEANWRDSVTNAVPVANSINPGTNINLHLQINSAAATITSGIIQFGTGSLTIGSANITATSLSGGTIIVNEGGYVTLSSANPLLNNLQMNFTSGIGWIKTANYNPTAFSTNNLAQIRVNNSPAFYAANLRLDNYYFNGCVIRANLTSATPLTVYDSTNLGGSLAAITVNTIHSSTSIANSMNNKIESFLLKKGFMVTFANEIDGTGKSINYIASEADLVINTLPATLQNSISFIRVMPWNWTTKKGFNAPVDSNLNASWRYQWNPNESSTLNWEFAPMAWGHTSANDPTDITSFIGKYNTPYVMSFNEPDDCTGQSGQYGNLCQTDVAVGYHKNLMKTGMRIVSPGGREEAPFGWLEEFYNKAKAKDIRIDVIAVHWYDWGSNPTVNTNPTALQVFNRFKAYLTNVHNLYGLPIWITEFNANPARSQTINAGFLELALPYLESLDYIERYCWFPFNTGTHFTTGWDEVTRKPTNTILSLVGTIYKNINNTTPVNSSPSIPESTVSSGNNLDLSSYPNIALNKPATVSSNLTNLGADKAVDGDKTTSTSRWVVELTTLPAWIEVDLQGSFLVDSFRITEDVNTVKNFRFEVWDATLNSGAGGWATALNIANNPATPPLVTYKTITPVNTTKVRLYVTGHNSSDRMRIFELEVFGTPSSPVWTGNTSTNWATASNWSTNTVPSQFSNVLINGGTPFQPTISATTTINSLTIATGATLTVTAPNLTIEGTIDNAGTMSLSNNSNLLQGEEFFPNSGNVSINRNSSALRRLDYSIWSSPVENQNLSAFSPETSLNRFYNYNQTSNLYNAEVSPTTTTFGLAAGHLIRMPNTHPATATVWNGTFTGVPNNGTINRVVTYKNEAPLNFGYNMIGNPYPSTLSASAFITENASKIENILYFWRKTNGAGGSAYATWINGIGGTVSGAGSAIPNGTIQVGQGFFVRAKPGTNLALLTFNQTLTFNNNMRLGNTSTQFFKTKQATEPDRVWLNLTNDKGVFSQALIGYVNGATQGIDDFDGKYINDSPIALTSNINNEEYTIQGRPTFHTNDIVALNFKTDVDGEYTIAIDHFDGVFANGQDVYLVDSKAGIETDLKAGAYNFTAVAGNDNSRFSLKYQKTLKVDAPNFNENSVRVFKNNGTLHINSAITNINNIKIYDIKGSLIAEQKNVNATKVTIKDLKVAHQVLIVKITGIDNNVVAKKVLY